MDRRIFDAGGDARATRPLIHCGAGVLTRVLMLVIVLTGCIGETPIAPSPEAQSTPEARVETVPDVPVLGAGFRFSEYGPKYDPGAEYWKRVGLEMAQRFENAVPETIWIVGRLHGEGVSLSFPIGSAHPLIKGSSTDDNEATLDLFDESGFRVWLQIEPGNAPVEDLIHLVLERYAHHPSVIGFGVDVEWYHSTEKAEGKAVTDAEATAWLAAVRSHNPDYRLFLKHWEIGKMPPTLRDGLLFVDDSQILPSLEAMVDEFAEWGEAFAPAPVAFQYGYPSDQTWWSKLEDPPGDIGRAIISRVPNAEGLYWVDFTVLELFPPEPEEAGR